MTLPISALVTRRSVEQQMIGVNVDLQSPAHRRDSKIEANPRAVRKFEVTELRLNGNALRS